MKNILFLGGFTSRSQGYIQALIEYDLKPDQILLFGSPKGNLPGQCEKHRRTHDYEQGSLFYPDLTVALMDTLNSNNWIYNHLECNHINDPLIYESIINISPDLIIYSGYGSQIVGQTLINSKIPFLHIHSGWLPDYKGSTTLYYSWLKENYCGASAILMDEQIDHGNIVKRKQYPVPPQDIDPDHIYDVAIRADLLIIALKEFLESGRFKNPLQQQLTGTEYYVIHPVLKHLVRLKNEKDIMKNE